MIPDNILHKHKIRYDVFRDILPRKSQFFFMDQDDLPEINKIHLNKDYKINAKIKVKEHPI